MIEHFRIGYTGKEIFVVLSLMWVFNLIVLHIIKEPKDMRDKFRYAAMALSALVLFMIGLGFWVASSVEGTNTSLPQLLFRGAAPLATLCGFYMVYLNFRVQREQSDQDQIRDHVKVRLDYHLDNMSEVEMVDPGNPPDIPATLHKGRRAFKFFLKNYVESHKKLEQHWLHILLYACLKRKADLGEDISEIEKFFEDWDPADFGNFWDYCKTNAKLIYEELEVHKNLRDRSPKQVFIVVVYLNLFFSKETFWEWLGDSFNREKVEEYRMNAVNPLLLLPDDPLKAYLTMEEKMGALSGSTYAGTFTVKMKDEVLTQFVEDANVESLDLQVYFGHYFRNLFNTYKYIDKIPYKSLREESARLVKNQLSTYEQALIFLNSLTNVGGVWELDPDRKTGKRWEFFKNYKVIENIPKGMLQVIDPKKDVYTYLDFEYEEYS